MLYVDSGGGESVYSLFYSRSLSSMYIWEDIFLLCVHICALYMTYTNNDHLFSMPMILFGIHLYTYVYKASRFITAYVCALLCIGV